MPDSAQVDTWKSLKKRLKPGGRIIANISDESKVAKPMLQVFEGTAKAAAHSMHLAMTKLKTELQTVIGAVQEASLVCMPVAYMMLVPNAVIRVCRGCRNTFSKYLCQSHSDYVGCCCRGAVPSSVDSGRPQLHCTDGS